MPLEDLFRLMGEDERHILAAMPRRRPRVDDQLLHSADFGLQMVAEQATRS